MPHTRLVLLLWIGAAITLPAQQPAKAVSHLPKDPREVIEAIDASYYHPDQLTTLNCTVSVDWPRFLATLKMTLPEDRVKAIEGLKIQTRAFRGRKPEITFDWSNGQFANSEQMESGFRQTISGFYQLYWPMIASSPISKASDFNEIEPVPNGGSKLVASGPNMKVSATIDRAGIPTHYLVDTPVVKITMDPTYTPSENPVAGDLRRISSLKVAEQIGASSMNYQIDLDYQEVNGFFVPSHATFDLVGAYSLRMSFTDCSASSALAVIANQ